MIKTKIAFTNFFFILCILIFIFSSCKPTKPLHRSYINNDSTSIFSTHPSRPFKYGYAYTKPECENTLRQTIINLDLHSGDIVADVGAASGYIEGAISVLVDSITFYIQDIDTNFLNQDQFTKVIDYYSNIKETPQTNRFEFVIGTEKTTELPEGLFDKIILQNTFHELKYKKDIINDIYTKLKPDGKLYITEQLSNKFKTRINKGCRIKAVTYDEVVKVLKRSKLYIANTSEPQNSFCNTFEFTKNKKDAQEYHKKVATVAPIITQLDEFYNNKIYLNPIQIEDLTALLKLNLIQLNNVFTDLKHCIYKIGDYWNEEKEYDKAKQILNLNISLFPQYSDSYESLGKVFFEENNYQCALKYYQTAYDLDTLNSETKAKIISIETLLKTEK